MPGARGRSSVMRGSRRDHAGSRLFREQQRARRSSPLPEPGRDDEPGVLVLHERRVVHTWRASARRVRTTSPGTCESPPPSTIRSGARVNTIPRSAEAR